MTPQERLENILTQKCECVKCKREVTPDIEADKLRCPHCLTVLFAVETRILNLLRSQAPDVLCIRPLLRKMLRKGWPKCPKCKRRVKKIGKHMSRRHPTTVQSEIFTEPEVVEDLFG